MGKLILLVVLILGGSGSALLSQGMYPVRGTVYVQDGKPDKISLTITCDQRQLRVPVDLNGDFVTHLDWGEDYLLCFSKPGYVGKKIDFSTHIPVSANKKMLYPYEVLVELFPMFPNADTAFFRNPVAKIRYSKTNYDFDYDLDYQLVVKDKIDSYKKKYAQWKKQGISRPVDNKIVSQQQKMNALQYQKSIKQETSDKTVPPKTRVTQIAPKKIDKAKDAFGLPALKPDYPLGKSVEIHELKGKVITRVIIKKGNYQKVFYRVKHNWGGLFYFVQESPENYRSISKYNFEKATQV